MVQVARSVTTAEWGFLSRGQYPLHDRDSKYCPAFRRIIDDAGVQRVPLPPRSPDFHAYAERWVRSVKDEAGLRLLLFGERSLHYALTQYEAHYHTERPHQGKDKGNGVLMPARAQGPVRKAHEGSQFTTPHERGGAGSFAGARIYQVLRTARWAPEELLALVDFAHQRTIEKLEAQTALDRLRTALPGVLSDR